MARCLVLGANGFIGKSLVKELLNDGHFVRCFDRYKSEESPVNISENTEIFPGDFLNRAVVDEALADIEYVFHFISTTTPVVSENEPLIDIETNILMSVELFSLCVKNKVKKIIFASTGGAIYGNTASSEAINESTVPRPVSPYAIGKLTIENYLRYFKRKHGLDYMVTRISNPYGPGQNLLSGQGVIPIFLSRLLQDEPITVYGDGSMIRDYLYIDDVAKMISGSFEKDSKAHTYNIASGTGHSVNDIVKTAENVTGKKFKIEHKDTPPTFVHHVVLDPTKFTSEYGIEATTTLEEGMQLTWQTLKKII